MPELDRAYIFRYDCCMENLCQADSGAILYGCVFPEDGRKKDGKNSMEEFLTKKAEKKRIWEIPAAIFSIIFTMAGISVVCRYIQEKEAMDIAVGIFLTALFAWPFFRIVIRRMRRREAERFAGCFKSMEERVIPFAQLDHHMHRKNSAQRLQRLIEKGFLQHIRLSLKNDTVILETAGEATVFSGDGKCPHCGALLPESRGSTVQCEFCGNILVRPQKHT